MRSRNIEMIIVERSLGLIGQYLFVFIGKNLFVECSFLRVLHSLGKKNKKFLKAVWKERKKHFCVCIWNVQRFSCLIYYSKFFAELLAACPLLECYQWL